MAKVVWKGTPILSPEPVALVTCGEGDSANILTIGWTGILNSHPPKTYISVRPSRYSYNIIKNSGEFVINLTTEELVRAADYCGVRSGANENKFERCSLETLPASHVKCPILAESPLSLECKVTEIIPLGSHDMFLADIVAADVNEELIDKSGKLHLERAHIAAFSHGEYFSLGKKLGYFGFSVAKKRTAARRK